MKVFLFLVVPRVGEWVVFVWKKLPINYFPRLMYGLKNKHGNMFFCVTNMETCCDEPNNITLSEPNNITCALQLLHLYYIQRTKLQFNRKSNRRHRRKSTDPLVFFIYYIIPKKIKCNDCSGCLLIAVTYKFKT